MAHPSFCLREVIESSDSAYLKNKTVIDVSNPVEFDNGPRLQLVDTSTAEYIQQLLPENKTGALVTSILGSLNTPRCIRASSKSSTFCLLGIFGKFFLIENILRQTENTTV
ncbi:hypothetical protein ABEV54_17455 [Peribacillus psychrosaccharolyticus]|uniref:hypothetical protein n=1 Tax=Peribacillus psychrosaccharolyticus TaxID=1407 RepID=UPI003D2E3326